jgi:hypothetical protein
MRFFCERRFLGAILILLLSACAAVEVPEPQPVGVEIEGVVIRNQLSFSVTEVQILALSTGNFLSCGIITARTACSTGFPNRYYTSGKLVVSWNERGVPHSTSEFVVTIDDKIDMSRPAWLEVLIFSRGEAGARLVQ